MNPTPIPCRTAYRVCGELLSRQAAQLRGRTQHTQARGRGRVSTEDARKKQAGRDAAAREIEDTSRLLFDWAERARGVDAGVDAAAFGYLVALLSGWTGARAELEAEMVELELGDRLDGLAWHDRAAVCRATIGGF